MPVDLILTYLSRSSTDVETLAQELRRHTHTVGGLIIRSLVLDLHFPPTVDTSATIKMWESVKKLILVLQASMETHSLTIRNPLPTAILRHRNANRGTIGQLKRVLASVDTHLVHLIDECAGSTRLQALVLTASSDAPFADHEKPRIVEMFPALRSNDMLIFRER